MLASKDLVFLRFSVVLVGLESSGRLVEAVFNNSGTYISLRGVKLQQKKKSQRLRLPQG